jgi:uncharacterized integral membrane protein
MVIHRFSWANFFIRLLFACLLVFATYNPSDYSYTRWVMVDFPASINAISAFVGVILIIGWVIYLRATWYSLGPIGLLLALAFFGAFVWLMIDLGLLTADNANVMSWIILVVISAILAVGMSWSHIRRRMTGQIDMDDVDDNN